MPTITLYTNKLSRGRIVHWMLEELGEPYKIQWLAFGTSMKADNFTAINPMGKVPVLQHGDVIVTETPAILTYLADAFPHKNLIPATSHPARAAFYRWMFFIAGPLETATSQAFLQLEVPEFTPLGTPSKGFLGYGSLALTLNTLEQHLQVNPYVCGNAFSAADIYLASHLSFGMHYTKAYPPRAVFTEYIERLNQRPAKQRAEAM